MQAKFKVGDKVRVVKNSHSGYWQPGYMGELTIKRIWNYGNSNFTNVTVLGQHESEDKVTDFTQDYDLTDLELIPHPNQKLANAVAEILRNTADFYLMQPNGQHPTPSSDNPAGWGNFYSCCAMQDCATDKKWSDSKIKRVIERFLRSLGVETESVYQFPGYWNTPQRQQARHAWLYIAAQFAEENPDLVPTYGKKKASV